MASPASSGQQYPYSGAPDYRSYSGTHPVVSAVSDYHTGTGVSSEQAQSSQQVRLDKARKTYDYTGDGSGHVIDPDWEPQPFSWKTLHKAISDLPKLQSTDVIRQNWGSCTSCQHQKAKCQHQVRDSSMASQSANGEGLFSKVLVAGGGDPNFPQSLLGFVRSTGIEPKDHRSKSSNQGPQGSI